MDELFRGLRGREHFANRNTEDFITQITLFFVLRSGLPPRPHRKQKKHRGSTCELRLEDHPPDAPSVINNSRQIPLKLHGIHLFGFALDNAAPAVRDGGGLQFDGQRGPFPNRR